MMEKILKGNQSLRHVFDRVHHVVHHQSSNHFHWLPKRISINDFSSNSIIAKLTLTGRILLRELSRLDAVEFSKRLLSLPIGFRILCCLISDINRSCKHSVENVHVDEGIRRMMTRYLKRNFNEFRVFSSDAESMICIESTRD